MPTAVRGSKRFNPRIIASQRVPVEKLAQSRYFFRYVHD